MFDGVDDWVTVPDANSLDLTADMTLEAWVYPTSLTGWRTVLLKEAQGNLAYALYAHANAPNPAGYATTSEFSHSVNGTAQLPLFTWTHLAFTSDGVTLELFVNGELAATYPYSGAFLTSAGPLRIDNPTWWHYMNTSSEFVALDGSSGAVRLRVPLGSTRFITIDAEEGTFESKLAANVSAPAITADGTAVVLTSKYTRTWECSNNGNSCVIAGELRYFDVTEVLEGSLTTRTERVRVESSGLDQLGQLFIGHFEPIVPDGYGGFLFTNFNSVRRVARNEYTKWELAPPVNFWDSFQYRQMVIGEDGAYLLLQRRNDNFPFEPVADNWATVMSFDARTMTVLTEAPFLLGGPTLQLKLGLAGGGVYIWGPQAEYLVNAAFGFDSPVAGDATQLTPGLFSGWVGGAAMELAEGGPVGDSFWGTPGGQGGRRHVVQRGIWLKGHPVALGDWHTSLRIVPSDQKKYGGKEPFVKQDRYGTYFATLGAGQENDDFICIAGTPTPLISAYNRARDVDQPAYHHEQLGYSGQEEEAWIEEFMRRDGWYRDDLPYGCWPETQDQGKYNSNSYISGLLNVSRVNGSRVGIPTFPMQLGDRFPGWGTPVPAHKFSHP